MEDKTLEGTVQEINRLAKKYLLISVPNDENPDKLSIRCPKCNFDYNRPNHLRSFDQNRLATLFPEFEIMEEIKAGKKSTLLFTLSVKFKKNASLQQTHGYLIIGFLLKTAKPFAQTANINLNILINSML